MRTIKEWQEEIAKFWALRGFKITEVFKEAKNRMVFQGSFKKDEPTVVKIAGYKSSLTIKTANTLWKDSEGYRKELAKIGVKVPGIKIEIEPESTSGKVYLIETAPHVGASIHQLLSRTETPDPETLKAVDSCLKDCFEPLFRSVSPGEDLRIGIDAVCRNFCIQEEGIYYVDFLPAKLYKAGKYMLEYPEPTDPNAISLGYYRHYTREGILHAFLVSLEHIRPEMRKLFLDIIESFLKDLGEKTVLYRFQHFPARRIKDIPKSESEEMIESLEFRDLYDLRDIACALVAGNQKYGREELDYFFDLTHFQSKPLPKESIEKAKNILIKMLHGDDIPKGKIHEA